MSTVIFVTLMVTAAVLFLLAVGVAIAHFLVSGQIIPNDLATMSIAASLLALLLIIS